MSTHYAWDYQLPFVHIVRDEEVRARCGSEVKVATAVMGARVCLSCTVVEMEDELRRIKALRSLYGNCGKPT